MLSQSQWSDEVFRELAAVADPEADAALLEIVNEKGESQAYDLFKLLIRNIHLPHDELPASINAFCDAHKTLPAWADPELIKVGEEVFENYGPSLLVFLYYKSLPMGYALADMARILVVTGRLNQPTTKDYARFSRRVAETGQFLFDVMVAGGLSNGGKGVETALRVRLIHASIRYFTRKEWDVAAYGVPIHQLYMVFTLMAFSILLLDALEQFGVELTEREKEGFYHHWMVTGSVMGVEERFLPADLASARVFTDKLLAEGAKPSTEGASLTQALIGFAEQYMPESMKNFPAIMIRTVVGDRLADILGLSNNPGCLAWLTPRFLRASLGLVQKLDDTKGPLNELLDQVSIRAVKSLIGFFNPDKNEHFRVPDHLKSKWGIGDS